MIPNSEKDELIARLTPVLRQELDLAGWEAHGYGGAPDPGALGDIAARLAYRVAVVLIIRGEPT